MLQITLNHMPKSRIVITLESGEKIYLYSVPKSGHVSSLLIDAPRAIKIKRENNVSTDKREVDINRIIWKEKDKKPNNDTPQTKCYNK